ncbi:hypothetical protein RDV64_05780 [Acuticoccus sp. MNP-M23]|uniref:hypothetical protein n=1 Tax=Acuticoccus sp. MNP-M23 TaxID=3072793 RepID=UPI0028150F76|nr:hypothetical protein [Acuticoccus sp. MNP-M23]WMS43900.1 hypothetical protein RDV64_05780 [Acuticoccus sp. MNP-M23]
MLAGNTAEDYTEELAEILATTFDAMGVVPVNPDGGLPPVLERSTAIAIAEEDRFSLRVPPVLEGEAPFLVIGKGRGRHLFTSADRVIVQQLHAMPLWQQTLDEALPGRASIVIETRDGEDFDVDRTAVAAMSHVLSEYASNVTRHGDPGQARISVEPSASGATFRFLNPLAGPEREGFPLHSSGRGLRGLRDRVEELGGRLDTVAEGDAFRMEVLLPAKTA